MRVSRASTKAETDEEARSTQLAFYSGSVDVIRYEQYSAVQQQNQRGCVGCKSMVNLAVAGKSVSSRIL